MRLLTVIYFLSNIILLAQWMPVSSPGIGNIKTLYHNDEKFYAGGNGIIYQLNADANWTSFYEYYHPNLSNRFVQAIVSVGDTILAGFKYSGIVRSTDLGITWDEVFTNETVNSLLHLGNKIIAGNQSGIYISYDFGETWTPSNSGLGNYPRVECLFEKNGVVYAGTYSGVYKSIDSCLTWEAINNGIENKSIFSITLNGNKIFAGSFDGVYCSTDNGTNWENCSTGLTSLIEGFE